MTKFLKILLVTLCTLILICILGTIALLTFVNPNHFKGQISQQVEKITGREFTINGNIAWSFFPWVGIQIDDADLANAIGFGPAPFIHIGEVDVKVKLLPLLTGHIEAATVVLKDSQANLTINKAGTNNWHDLVSKTTDSKQQGEHISATETTGKHTEKLNVLVSGIDISKASVNWHNEQTDQQAKIMLYKLKSTHINFDGNPFNVKVRLNAERNQPAMAIQLSLDTHLQFDHDKQHYKATDLNLSSHLSSVNLPSGEMDFALQTDAVLDLAKQTLKLDNWRSNLNDLTVQGTINGTNLMDAPQFSGSVTIPTFNLASFLQSMGIQTRGGNALRSASAKLEFNATNNSLNIPKVSATIDKSTLNGKFAINDFAARSAEFNFNINRLDLNRYQFNTTKAQPSSQRAATLAQTRASISDNDTNQPATPWSARGNVTIGQLRVGKVNASNVNASIYTNKGITTINPLRAGIYGGSLNGNITINQQNPTPRYKVVVGLNNFSIPAITGNNKITGRGNAKANISMSGNASKTLLKTMNGNASIALSSGAIKGLDVIGIADMAYSALRLGQLPSAPKGKATQYGSMTASARIKSGVAYNNDLRIRSSLATVKGKGKINLVTQAINYHLELSLNQSSSAFNALQGKLGGPIPVKVTGTLSNPKIVPDMAALMTRGVGQAIGGGVEDVKHGLKNTTKDIGKQLKSLKSIFDQ